MDPVRLLSRCFRYQVLGTLMLTALLALFKADWALGAGLSGLLMASNFGILKLIAQKTAAASEPRQIYYLLWPVKFAMTLGAFTVFAMLLKLHIASLALGLGIFVVAILAAYTHTILEAPGLSPNKG